MIYQVTRKEFGKGRIRVMTDADGVVVKVYAEGNAYVVGAYVVLMDRDSKLFSTHIWSPAYVSLLRESGYDVREEEEDMATNLKVALWCRLWEEFKGKKYAINAREPKQLAGLRVDEPLLRWYLNDVDMPQNATTWLWRAKQSIDNLSRYYNQVKVAMDTPAEGRHPNHWDPAYLKKLDGAGIGEYHAHLKSLGLVAKHHRDGTILDYVKP